MNDRIFPYEHQEVCDLCGNIGAFDIYGDLICDDCLKEREEGEEKDENKS